jgi:hypothetical protein
MPTSYVPVMRCEKMAVVVIYTALLRVPESPVKFEAVDESPLSELQFFCVVKAVKKLFRFKYVADKG